MTTARAGTKKASTKTMGAKKSETKKVATRPHAVAEKTMPKEGKDPKGGLTAKGREFFNRTEGSHLKPGVTGAADTPEKMRRKGSFLRRHFTHPRGPMQDDQGRPTRLALSAHAWGELVPKDLAAAKKLAAKGHALLEKYHTTQESKAAKKGSSGIGAKAPAKKRSEETSTAGKSAAAAKKKITAKKISATKA